MNMRIIRQTILVVLLSTPVLVLAQTSPASNSATPAAPARPDFRPGKIDQILTQEQLQAIMNPAVHVAAQKTQTTQNESLPDIVVRGDVEAAPKTRIPIQAKPCGLASIVWFIQHPADGWRVLAPVDADSELNACLKPAVPAAPSQYQQF